MVEAQPDILDVTSLNEAEEALDEDAHDPTLEEQQSVKTFITGHVTAGKVEFTGSKEEHNSYTLLAKEYASEKPKFEEIDQKTIEQAVEVFIEPPEYPRNVPSGRTLIVSGEPHSGRFCCSVVLAATIQARGEASSILKYNRQEHEVEPLVQSVSSLEPGSILILEDAFKNNRLSEREVSTDLVLLNTALSARRSFIVLTTTCENLKTSAPNISTKGLQISKVFESHFRRFLAKHRQAYETSIESIRSQSDNLIDLLIKPAHVDLFFRLAHEEKPSSRRDILRIAHAAAQGGGQELRKWFSDLPPHVKLLGSLAHLLEGVADEIVERTFVESVSALRAQNFEWIADARELGLKDAWSLLRSGTRVHDDETSIREELEWQIENRRILAWSVIQRVAASVHESRFWREDQGARRVLGAAVGRLGSLDEPRFRAIQDLWAHSRNILADEPNNSMGTLPGYAFVKRLKDDPKRGSIGVLRILTDWIDSRDPDLMWSAGASIWLLYWAVLSINEIEPDEAERMNRGLIDRLYGLIVNSLRLPRPIRAKIRSQVEAYAPKGELGDEAQRSRVELICRVREFGVKLQLRYCAVFALKKIGEVDIRAFVSTVSQWFADEKAEVLGWVASQSVRFTFQELAQKEEEPSTQEAASRLSLVNLILTQRAVESLAVGWTFVCLARWCRFSDCKDAIKHHLLCIANQENRTLRGNLRAALSRYWLSDIPEKLLGIEPTPAATEVPETQAQGQPFLKPRSVIARTLIARSYSMDGVLTESPALGHCLVIVDPYLIDRSAPRKAQGPEAQLQSERREGALRQVLAMVEVIMAEKADVTVLVLGALTATAWKDGSLTLTTDLPLHRLMKPGLQNLASHDFRVVLLLTAGPVVDLEDGLDAVDTDHKLVVAAGCDLEVPEGTELLRIGRDLSARDLEAIEAKLRLLCARAQATLDPAGWEPLLVRLGVDVEELDANPLATLGQWAAQLGELPAPESHDPAKKILCALLRLAAADFDACLQIIHAWLTEGTDLERPMAAGAAGALFRAVTNAPGIWGGSAPQSLFDKLAGPLAKTDAGWTDFILETVERWLADPVLAEVLAGAIEDGRCRLLRWAEDAAPEKVEDYRKTVEKIRWSLKKDGLGPSGEVLDAVFDRLSVRLAIGRRRELPKLAAGESYAVIVFDATARRGPLAAARWGPLAAELFKRFNQKDALRKPLLYRLGERSPAWMAGDPQPIAADLSPVGVRLPRLLGPILQVLSPDSVSFLIVLADEMWIDGEDWIGSPWRERIFTVRQLPNAPFQPLLTAFPRRPGQEKEEVDLMERYLNQQLPLGIEESA
jgi:hypothetical protein